MPDYDYSNVNFLWDMDTTKKKGEKKNHDNFKVARKLTWEESKDALNFWNVTKHFKERVYRLNASGMGIGMVASGFLVDKGHENGMEEHYITTTGLIIIRNHNSGQAITILVARPEQVKRYYDELGHLLPSKILKVAERNRSNRLNH